MDLARILNFNRYEAVKQSDIVYMNGRVVKNSGYKNLPKLFSIEKVEVVDNQVVTTIIEIQRVQYHDGKDHIRR
jgi:hypothetical protein